MKIFLVITLAVFCLGNLFSQVLPSSRQCPKPCGPPDMINFRTQIDSLNLALSPNNYILHQEIKGFHTNYSTGSFISPNMIITAKHNVNSAFLKNLKFCNKSVNPNKWVTFKKNEVEILSIGDRGILTDVVIIKFKDADKIKEIYRGHFELGTVDSISSSTKIHLTGFPCDLPDILVDKSTEKDKLNLTENTFLVGYYIYTCTGDSGAPLWVIINGKAEIIGVHHGGGENIFPDGWNCSVKITQEIINLIRTF